MEKKIKITYRGWPGHFICAHQCLFRLNTLIEYGRKRIVVSTVGMMQRGTKPDGRPVFDTVGHNRHYETMAFWAAKSGDFWDADVSRQIYFDAEWSWPNVEDEMKAQKGHESVVAEIAGRLERGEM